VERSSKLLAHAHDTARATVCATWAVQRGHQWMRDVGHWVRAIGLAGARVGVETSNFNIIILTGCRCVKDLVSRRRRVSVH